MHRAKCSARTKATVLFVAHDMNPLLHVMDRVLYMAGGGALLGRVDDVVNSESLSRLYSFPIEVVRAENRVFVLSKEGNVTESAPCLHRLDMSSIRSSLISATISSRTRFWPGHSAAILGAIVGYFVVIRNVGFAAHALAHIGFAGAAGAALLGVSPLQGMLLLTVGSGVFMGATGDRVHRSDMAIGMVLSMSLGLGMLFLSLYAGFAGAGHRDSFRRYLWRFPAADSSRWWCCRRSAWPRWLFSRANFFSPARSRVWRKRAGCRWARFRSPS